MELQASNVGCPIHVYGGVVNEVDGEVDAVYRAKNKFRGGGQSSYAEYVHGGGWHQRMQVILVLGTPMTFLASQSGGENSEPQETGLLSDHLHFQGNMQLEGTAYRRALGAIYGSCRALGNNFVRSAYE